MNLTQLSKIAWGLAVLVVLVVVALIAILTFALLGGKRPSPTPSPPTLQTPPSTPISRFLPPQEEIEKLPISVKEIRKKIIQGYIDNRGGDLMLYKTANFEIEYIPPVDLFLVKIFKDPAAEAKKQAQDWFLKFGLKQSDLCNLPVRFSLAVFKLKATNPNFNTFPEGCPR